MNAANLFIRKDVCSKTMLELPVDWHLTPAGQRSWSKQLQHVVTRMFINNTKQQLDQANVLYDEQNDMTDEEYASYLFNKFKVV